MNLVLDKQLRFIFSVTSGATPASGNPEYWDGDIWWATPEDIGKLPTYWLRETRRTITEEGYESCGTTLAPRGAIVLTKRAPIGKAAILAEPACSNQGCFLLTPKKQQDTRFFYYWLSIQEDRLQALGRGSTFLELSTDDLKSLYVVDPPLEVQRGIAEFLDRETARIDQLIAAKERSLELLAEKRRALITHAVTKGINPDAESKDSGVAWLGEIPKHWKVIRIAWLFHERDQRGEPDLPLLVVSINHGVMLREFSNERIESTASDFNTYKVARCGDVVFNKMRMWQGAVGVAPVDGLVSPDYVVAEPTGALKPDFAELLFRTQAFSAESAAHSYGIVWDRLRLYWDGFRDIYVALPPVAEQDAIINDLSSQSNMIRDLGDSTERSIGLLKERREALIAAAVTGKIEFGTAV